MTTRYGRDLAHATPRRHANPEVRDRAAFRALVERQDRGGDPRRAEREVCRAYGLSRAYLAEVVERGVAETWPPLVEED